MSPNLLKASIVCICFFTTASITVWSMTQFPKTSESSLSLAVDQGGTATIIDGSTLIWTAELVAAHNTQNDCWTIIHNNIYNISQYIPFHPGGTQTIIATCGKDGTSDFETKGGRGRPHLASTTDILKQYFIASIGDPLTANSQPDNTTSQPNQSANPQNPSLQSSPAPTIPQQTNTVPGNTSLTTAVVASHNSASDCWLIISGSVYSVSQYIPFHPGGTQQIINYCGKEATQAFNSRGSTGSHSSTARNLLANYKIGVIGQSSVPSNSQSQPNPPIPTAFTPPNTNPPANSNPPAASLPTVLDSATVSKHNTSSDCWLIVSSKVYNVTQYIPYHPGGTQQIVNYCGKEATSAFDTQGGKGNHSNNARSLLANYYLGDLNSTSSGNTGSTTSPTSPPSQTGSGYATPEAAVLAAYPGAVINKVEREDDGRSSVKFTYQGDTYEAKLDAQNIITKVDD